MKQLNIPFKLGMQYENWEFDLEVLDLERIPNYDSYLYLGELKKFLNYISDKTELIFYCDRLEAVILTFENKDWHCFNEFSNALKMMFRETEAITLENHLVQKFKHKNIEYWCVFNPQTNTIIVIYGVSDTIQQVLLSLLS
jgi:hypothetical protein